MARERFYLDTSVWGGKFDPDFMHNTEEFFNIIKANHIACLYSEIVEMELMGAPSDVCMFFEEWPFDLKEKVEITPAVLKMADAYIDEGVVGKTSRKDCIHIAAATVCWADMLVSWNFKHIANIYRIKGYNGINVRFGYPILRIFSPKEVIDSGY